MGWTRPPGNITLGQGNIANRPTGGLFMKQIHVISIDLAKHSF